MVTAVNNGAGAEKEKGFEKAVREQMHDPGGYTTYT